MSRNLRNLALATVSIACLLVLHAPRMAAAQTCDEDGGDEDAGDEDGGLACEPADSGAPGDEPDASLPDAGDIFDAGEGGMSEACSCDTVENSSAGTIHVCTGARDRSTCRYLECDTTIKRPQSCSTDDVELCCEMPSRGIYSQLYADCDHPNCETGFRAQCHDFGGSITPGPCVVGETTGSGDDSGGGICSVQPGRRAAGGWGAALWLAALVLALRAARKRRV